MYRALLAEDEPAAMRYLRTLIENHFPDFSIVATASNGKEALEYAEKLAPDVVLTDVKMPLIDGLELVARLKESSPKIPVVIVSGYQDFEYVRRALNTGVVDYVLKPVTSRRLAEVFQRIGGLLRRNADERSLLAFRRLLDGDVAEQPEDDGAVRLAILRYGAPPSRFSYETGYHLLQCCRDGFCTLLGRDEHEAILVCSSMQFGSTAFADFCKGSIEPSAGPYHTMLLEPDVVSAAMLAKAVDSLYSSLDRLIVLGRNQILRGPLEDKQKIMLDRMLPDRIEEAVINSNTEALTSLIKRELGRWEDAQLPAIDLQTSARKMIEFVQQAAVRAIGETELNSSLEQSLVRAASFQEFGSSLCELAMEVAGLTNTENDPPTSSSVFTAIRSYLEDSYAQAHTVESIRARFRISPSYLTKLFRANTGHSFNEYLTLLRIDAAKKLLLESPEMPIKNIARYVGYRDPFYFSRVFRNVTGKSPTEFLETQR
jgi:YesN/AraC family two-component response regulator